MIKTTLLGSTLAVALSAGPAMAADFQARADLQGPAPTPLTDAAVTATEGERGTVSRLSAPQWRSRAQPYARVRSMAPPDPPQQVGSMHLPGRIAVGFVALGVVTDVAVAATERRATCTSGGSTVTAAAICGSAIGGASGSTAAGAISTFQWQRRWLRGSRGREQLTALL